MKKLSLACLQLSPVILSSLLISAHFLRHGRIILTGIGFVPLAVLLIRHPISARITQVILLLATGIWIWTLVTLVRQRVAAGLPYAGVIWILGGVIVFTLTSAFVFRFRTLRDFYKLDSGRYPNE